MTGYQNNVLRVNLNGSQVSNEPLNEEWAEKYIGGKGLGIKFLYEELEPGLDPLSPDNKLVLTTGPMTGTVAPCSGKLAISAKSPATGTVLDCSIGGHIANEIKFAGYDAVVLEGKAKEPSYLLVEDDHVEVKPAGELWGKGSFETEKTLKNWYEDAQVLSIGPAGENLLRMACINADYYRQAGRGGIGAVMGSKNIKAIVVKGSKGVKVADIDGLLKKGNEIMRNDTLTEDNLWTLSDGTSMIVELSQTAGILPTRNFQDGTFEKAEAVDAEAVRGAKKANKACGGCALGCGNFVKVGDSIVEGPEYETIALGASNCGIGDLGAVIEFNARCDDLGLDTISVANAAAFAMELTEKGIHDFGITFGDVEKYLEIPQKVAYQEGIGVELAKGVRWLADKYGGKDFAMEVKDLEIPGYDPRGSWGMGLAYATADRGACHLRAWPAEDEAFGDEWDAMVSEGKAGLVKEQHDANSAKFSLILCDFWGVDPEIMAELYQLVTGKNMTGDELLKVGARVYNLARLFNQREGFTREHDVLPNRVFNDPLQSGFTKGKVLPKEEFEKMLKEYYELRGWDEQGNVTEETMKALGM